MEDLVGGFYPVNLTRPHGGTNSIPSPLGFKILCCWHDVPGTWHSVAHAGSASPSIHFWGSATQARGSRAHSVASPLASFTQRAAGARGSHLPLCQRAAGARGHSSLPSLGYEAVRCVTHRGALLGRVGLWGEQAPDGTHTRHVHYYNTVLVPEPFLDATLGPASSRESQPPSSSSELGLTR